MTMCVALFRGINVGGRQMVKMNELKELHETLGLRDVVTYVQTGNVVFTCDDADVAQLPERIGDAFANKFGFRVNVMVRTAAEFDEVIARSPFQNQPEKETKWIVVLFLANRLESVALEDLQRAYTGPEELHFIGQELYTYYPNGIGRSKLTVTLIEKKLKTSATGRNWNTVLQLQKMMSRENG